MIRRAFVRALSGAILTTLLGVKAWRLEVEEWPDWDFVAVEDPDGPPDFYSSAECPRPYLMLPHHFSETDVDYPSGASVFGVIHA